MRHRVEKKKMGRTASHRSSLARNLASELILHEKINTTLEKAKFVKPFVEKMITKAKRGIKSGSTVAIFNTSKSLMSELGNEKAVRKLIENLTKRFENRRGGYTKIIKTGNRDGDNAKTARIELLPEEKPQTDEKAEKKKEEKKPHQKTKEKGKDKK